ncbi:hypothetical protein GCM10022393_25030 [Aquimarina addita]|uniref:Uncharacterized protein n=1 Tax=Aquimarina addita TaxID=870485 RepID=A0ABP6UPK5_9FLAO
MKRYAISVITITIVLLLILFFSVNTDEMIRNKIEEGEIVYSNELGFINWDHAKPEGTLRAFRELQRLNRTITNTVTFSYSQQMIIRVGSFSAVAEYTEERNIPRRLTSTEELVFFLEIFTSVTESFEKMQGELPYGIIPQTKASSFREGDLMGNLLSFYIAVSDENLNEIRSDLTILTTTEAYEVYENLDLSHDQLIDWSRLLAPLDDSFNIVCTLKQIIDLSTKIEQPLSIKTAGKKRFYFL